jgi:sulfur carrier protein
MEIQLNNQRRIITAPLSVQQLLDEVVGEKQKGIAVAINNTVVPKATWAQQLIQTNDNIIIIKATQGG